jgi:hypothetical protein
MRTTIVMTLGILFATTASAQSVVYTRTDSDEIWTADASGAGVPTLFVSGVTGSSQGPVGIVQDTTTGEWIVGGGNDRDVWLVAADGSSSSVLTDTGPSDGEGLGVAVDPIGGLLFTASDQPLGIGPLDGSTEPQYVSSFDAHGVVYDDIGDMVYFSGQDAGNIASIEPTGANETILYSVGGSIRGITHDGTTGMLYWVDRGANSGIYAASDDGLGTPTLLFPSTGGYHITLDEASGTLYWAEFDGGVGSTNGRIMTGSVSGGVPTVLFEGPDLASIRGIALAGTITPPSGPRLQISGSCPTSVTFTISGLTPNGPVSLIRSSSPGTASVPVGPCAGTQSGLSANGAGLAASFNATASGRAVFSNLSLPPGACGATIQVLDVASCTFTNVDTVP